jgi:hypothetical protein
MQPSIESQNELNSIIENLPDFVKIRKKIYKIKWLHPITIRKINQIILKEGNDDRASHQTAACIILNNFFKLKFIYPFLWRWFYYVKQYTEADLTEVIAVGKKKIPLQSYYVNTILMTDMKDTTMAMTKKEASSIRQGHVTVQSGTSQKNTAG